MTYAPRPSEAELTDLSRQMSPGEKLQVTCNLSDRVRRDFRRGFRRRNRHLSEEDFRSLFCWAWCYVIGPKQSHSWRKLWTWKDGKEWLGAR